MRRVRKRGGWLYFDIEGKVCNDRAKNGRWILLRKELREEMLAERKKRNHESGMAIKKERYRTDPEFKILCNMRSNVERRLKRVNSKKYCTTDKYMGCSPKFFKEYLESLFTEGMSWDLFLSGEISIDHIRPCASFDLTDPKQQRECFHYSNCQPMWTEENKKKSSWYNGVFYRAKSHKK
jgi:hypothetical protein